MVISQFAHRSTTRVCPKFLKRSQPIALTILPWACFTHILLKSHRYTIPFIFHGYSPLIINIFHQDPISEFPFPIDTSIFPSPECTKFLESHRRSARPKSWRSRKRRCRDVSASALEQRFTPEDHMISHGYNGVPRNVWFIMGNPILKW